MTRRERQRRQAKRQRYTMLAMLALGLVVGVLVATLVGNARRLDALRPVAQVTLEECEQSTEIEECNITYNYDGTTLVDFVVSGRSAGGAL